MRTSPICGGSLTSGRCFHNVHPAVQFQKWVKQVPLGGLDHLSKAASIVRPWLCRSHIALWASTGLASWCGDHLASHRVRECESRSAVSELYIILLEINDFPKLQSAPMALCPFSAHSAASGPYAPRANFTPAAQPRFWFQMMGILLLTRAGPCSLPTTDIRCCSCCGSTRFSLLK